MFLVWDWIIFKIVDGRLEVKSFSSKYEIYRSVKMELYKITIPKDDAWHVIEAFGQKGFAHLIDLNKQE